MWSMSGRSSASPTDTIGFSATTQHRFRYEGGDQRLRMRNVMTLPSCRVCSSVSPVSRSRVGISMAASGSVHAMLRMSPEFMPASALRARNTGSGHLRPRKSKVCSAIAGGCQAPSRVANSPRRLYHKVMSEPMRVIGLAGWSGSGKTTLVTKVIPVLVGRGLKVATVKHAHHEFDLDKPGKDSWLHREAGASEVAIASSRRWALIHELRGEPEPSLVEILNKLSPVNLVIVEGFKRHAHPKLEVYRPSVGKPLLHPEDDCIVAIATDRPMPQAPLPVLMLDDIEAIANVLQAEALPRDQIGPASERS